MPLDRSVHSDVGERPGPFDIEREDVVLARVVDTSVPIQTQTVAPRPVDAAPTLATPAPWAPAAEPPGEPEAEEERYPASHEGEYPALVEGFSERPSTVVRPLRPDGQEWAASPAAGRRRRMPAFTMTRRGFEPAEVEMYLAQQDDALAAAVERADTAERQLAEALTQLASARERVSALEDQQRSEPPASIRALGDRVADILERAWQAAEELRAGASGAAERAQTEADEVVRTAESEARAQAAEIVAEAERHRRVVLEELASRRAEHDAEVSRLTAERQSALNELERLHSMLQRVLVPQTPSGAGGGDTGEPAVPAPGGGATGPWGPGQPSASSAPAPSAGPVPTDDPPAPGAAGWSNGAQPSGLFD